MDGWQPNEKFYATFSYISVIFTAAGSLIMAMIISGNVLVLVSIARTPKLQTITNMFVANLAMADLMVGTISYPMFLNALFINGERQIPHWLCIWTGADMLFPLGMSFLTILTITVDRYIFIIKPLHYSTIMTKKRVWILLISIWIISVVTGGIPFATGKHWTVSYPICMLSDVYPQYFMILTCILVVIITTIITILYIQILKVARRHSHQIDIQCSSVGNTSFAHQKKGRLDGIRQAKLFLIVIGIMYISWIPGALISLSFFLAVDKTVLYIMGSSCTFYVYSFSLANPLIYAAKSKDFRTVFHDLLRKPKTFTCIR